MNLNHTKILTMLPTSLAKHIELEVFDTIESTNDYLLNKKTDKIAVCLADYQTRGKGRLGRLWHSPSGVNLYLSLKTKTNKPPHQLKHLSVAIAECLAKLLRTLGFKNITIKHPNDVLINQKKCAGILIETNNITDQSCDVVIGIGLNVNMTHDNTHEIDQAWTSLKEEAGKTLNRNELASLLIKTLARIVR